MNRRDKQVDLNRRRYRNNKAVLTIALLMTLGSAHAQDNNVPANAKELRLFSSDWKNLQWISEFGKFEEIARSPRKPIYSDKQNLLRSANLREEREYLKGERIPDPEKLSGTSVFEFFDIESNRSFAFHANRSDMASFSKLISLKDNFNMMESNPPSKTEIILEDVRNKSWSNATDNRTRRGASNGFSDTNSIYQSIANYGGCTANVLTANQNRMVAITAAHCIFGPENVFRFSKIQPRAEGGSSPTWGNWTPYAFGYYPAYVNNNCEDNWNGGNCIKHDIALVIARPDPGASAPRGMGWGYQPKSTLEGISKYRRGYPGCGYEHSPLNCNGDTLYGDGSFGVAHFSKLDHDDWNRQIRFSSDVNPGDSGSGLYAYSGSYPYVFGVTSAEQSCTNSCTSTYPNYARRITPQFFDFINSVAF